MSYDPYNYNRSGKKGPKLILIILLFCVGSFVVWFVTQTDNPDRNKIADFLYDTFGFGSPDIYFESYDKDTIYNYLLTEVGSGGKRKFELKFATDADYRKAVADLFESADYWDKFNREIHRQYGISFFQRLGTLNEHSHRLEIELR